MAAGYDCVARGDVDDILVTSGLANCIAIAVKDTGTGKAVLAHFNTGAGPFPSDEGALRFYLAARTLLLDELVRFAGKKVTPVFTIGLGTVWIGGEDSHEKKNDKWFFMRHALLLLLRKVFGTEPTEAGETIRFIVSSGKMVGEFGIGEKLKVPKDWAHAGEEINYSDLKGSDESKWKLKKHQSYCFLTTACVTARGLADDCDELVILRRFRDTHVRAQHGGERLILEYYSIAPHIVSTIEARADRWEWLDELYVHLVLGSLRLIENGRRDEAMAHYRRVVEDLKRSCGAQRAGLDAPPPRIPGQHAPQGGGRTRPTGSAAACATRGRSAPSGERILAR